MIRLLPMTFLACAACTPMAPPETAAPPPSEGGAQCDVSQMLEMVGERATPGVVERARKQSGARTVRRYASGSALTMDFRPDRLNVEVGELGRIVKLSCG
jgi:hypothetical protein